MMIDKNRKSNRNASKKSKNQNNFFYKEIYNKYNIEIYNKRRKRKSEQKLFNLGHTIYIYIYHTIYIYICRHTNKITLSQNTSVLLQACKASKQYLLQLTLYGL